MCVTDYGLFISFILQSSSYYPFVTQAHTVIPASPLSDYQGILPLPWLSHYPRSL